MKTEKLIEIAKKCGIGTCHKECPYKCENAFDGIVFCMEDLIKELTNKLEMAVSDINKNCGNCMYKSSDYRQLPCSVCEALEFSKWEWQGDAK